MKNLYLLSLVFTIFSSSIFAQSPSDVKKIIANYDVNKLKEREIFYRKKTQAEKQKAIAVAKINNWPIVIENENGSFSELMKLTADGYPIYYTTDNANAARSTRTNFLHTGGALGLNLDGQGMTVRVWDGGAVRASHTAFGGRVTVIDDPAGALSGHSTHVCGTMVAASPANIKGMAPQATARTFDWDSDEAEALSEIQLGMLISNHSYGVPLSGTGGPLDPWIIGAYIYDSYAWDEIAYLSPYYLQVASAGNDGNSNANAEPIAFGYDKLTTNKTSKNNLVVANAQDATIAANGTVTSVLINSSSSQGPTDDFRIKPDITGNGTGLSSTSSANNTATASLSGTSMSSPNVAGTLILLQQHYKNLTNNFMRSATLKGLACHTADDEGEIGPDPIWGWGLLNAKKAAETLTGNGLTSWVSEENLNQGQTYSINVNSTGTEPLIASITWTDVPGPINTGGSPVNDPTPALVNDLDIRITRNTTTFYPWKLVDPLAEAIRTGDNNVDNVEQVKIDSPTAGNYTITVTHKGTIVNNSQKYSLVITGISSSFALNSTTNDLTVCSDQNAIYNFNYTQTGGGTTNFTATGLPIGATATFSPSSLSANGAVSMTVSGLSSIVPGEYSVGIVGNNGIETETRYKLLRVFNSTFQNTTLNSPTNGQIGLSTSAVLKWDAQVNAESYTVHVSTSPTFSSLVTSEIVTTNTYTVSGLNQETRYYWRVTPSNQCGTANASSATVFSFDTGTLECNLTYTATDYSNAVLPSVANSTASVPLTITGGHIIGDLNVNITMSHTYVQDMTISLQGPASIGSPVIILLEEPCGDNDNINCTMDDDGSDPACAGNPAISGSIVPLESLTALNSLPADGVWTLLIDDPYDGDGGTVSLFSITMCRVAPALGISENPSLANSSVYPNPTTGTVNISIPNIAEKTTITLFDLQGRNILSTETDQINSTFNIENLQDGVYLVTLQNSMGATSKKIILRK
ncbi:MAG: S8 family serine peptidase [Bacteroidota bacterium]